jgi:hypothetical protein
MIRADLLIRDWFERITQQFFPLPVIDDRLAGIAEQSGGLFSPDFLRQLRAGTSSFFMLTRLSSRRWRRRLAPAFHVPSG